MPGWFLLSEMCFATESIKLSIDCIGYLFFSIASLRNFESNAILMELSCFTVKTMGLIKTLSEHLSSLMIRFVSNRWRISLSTLSARCSGTRRPLCRYGCMSRIIVDFTICFFDLPKRVHRCWNFFMMQNCMEVSDWTLFTCVPLLWERVNPSFPSTSRPNGLTVLELTTRTSFSVDNQWPDFRFIWIAPVMGISRLLKHL